MAWKGNIVENPAPDSVREVINRSEKPIAENRAEQIRRDTDEQKNFTVSFYDIDETILSHLSNLQLQVKDTGAIIKVPAYYGSPERWTSAQRDGYIRDEQGKMILPAIIFKRDSSENDQSLQFFNRYLNVSAIKLFSEKNKYTQFSILNGQNAPISDVYNIVIPSHVILTYHFIVWTEYVEQMNKLIETIQYNTKDYWGSKRGFRFRTRVESYSHTVEVQEDEDRIVKTEFDLVTHGYILPDQIVKLDSNTTTTKKVLTPKKIIIGAEVVSNGFDFKRLNKNEEKWRNPTYPNIALKTNVPLPPVNFDINNSIQVINQVFNAIQIVGGSSFKLPPPQVSSDPGTEGTLSYDDSYYYIYTNGEWKRVPIALFSGGVNF